MGSSSCDDDHHKPAWTVCSMSHLGAGAALNIRGIAVSLLPIIIVVIITVIACARTARSLCVIATKGGI